MQAPQWGPGAGHLVNKAQHGCLAKMDTGSQVGCLASRRHGGSMLAGTRCCYNVQRAVKSINFFQTIGSLNRTTYLPSVLPRRLIQEFSSPGVG